MRSESLSRIFLMNSFVRDVLLRVHPSCDNLESLYFRMSSRCQSFGAPSPKFLYALRRLLRPFPDPPGGRPMRRS